MKEKIMGKKNWNEVAELAAIDISAREGISRFDKLSKLDGESEIGGFQLVDSEADPAAVPVEQGEDVGLRAMADFFLLNHCLPEAAAEQAAERIAANAEGQAALRNVCVG
jgi:hypothetical protein